MIYRDSELLAEEEVQSVVNGFASFCPASLANRNKVGHVLERLSIIDSKCLLEHAREVGMYFAEGIERV